MVILPEVSVVVEFCSRLFSGEKGKSHASDYTNTPLTPLTEPNRTELYYKTQVTYDMSERKKYT